MRVRRPPAGAVEVAIGIGLVVAFAVYRVWQALTGLPLIWQDSTGYQQSSLWSGARPPVAPLLWRVTGTPTSFVVVQTVIAIVAWCFLAWTAALLARPGWPRVLTGFVVLAFASTAPIVMWDRSVLSESLSFSALALVFATAIRVTHRVTWPRVAALVAASTALALVRDSLLWIVFGLALAILAYAVAHNAGRKVLVLGVVLLAVAGYAIIGQAAAHRNIDNVEHVLFVRIFPFPDRVAWFADHGMPDKQHVLAYAAATKAEPGQAKVVGIAAGDRSVQPLVHWLHTDATAVYLEWLALHPAYVLTEPLRDPERAFNNALGNLAFYAAPDRSELPIVNTVFDPGPWWVAAATAVAVAIGVTRGVWRRRWWRMVALLGGLGVLEMLVAWHGDGTETTRHGIVGSVSVRLAIVILVMAGALAPTEGRRSGVQPDRSRRQRPTAPGYAPAVISEPGRI
jgi:hypothetical protein